jgi:Flp pilus assembly secretin CpaC
MSLSNDKNRLQTAFVLSERGFPEKFLCARDFKSFALFIALATVLCVSGCGDFFAKKPTEMNSRRIREQLREVKPVPDANVYIHSRYSDPPKIVKHIVGGTEEWKLFYFCKHHSSEKLAEIVNDQFATKLFDKKGKETKIENYKVSNLASINQLIVRCPTNEDVQAVLDTLKLVDVKPIQVRIDCLISEVYADKTMDWETTLEVFNLFGINLTAGGSARPYGDDVLNLIDEGGILPAFPGASLREVVRSKMGLKIGFLDDNFLAVVDLLESKGYLKILMNPTLEVVDGQKARIESSEHVPLEQVFLRDRNDNIETRVEYIDVIDALEVIPHVFADGYIGLETTVLIGSKNIPDGVKQIRIVSKREIYNKENRIRQGQSLVIGGIRKSEESAVVRGVPFLKDLPIIGPLFSSKDYEERAVETIFILTPTISTGGVPNKEMVETITERHARPNPADEMNNKVNKPIDKGADAKEAIPPIKETSKTAPMPTETASVDTSVATQKETENVQSLLDRLSRSLQEARAAEQENNDSDQNPPVIAGLPNIQGN